MFSTHYCITKVEVLSVEHNDIASYIAKRPKNENNKCLINA